MTSLHDHLLKVLAHYADDDIMLIKELDQLTEENGNEVCCEIFRILTSIDLEPEQAAGCWSDVTSHFRELGLVVNRDLSLRTAACDYFCSIDKQLKNPKIIEIESYEQTARSSKYDRLTGLRNRHSFDETLKREIARAFRHSIEVSFLFLDLDDFKSINDKYGHPAGDTVLRAVGEIIKNAIRLEDIAARYGGEEIVLLLPETDTTNAMVLAERIRTRIEAMRFAYEGQVISLTVSGGLASFPADALDAKALIRLADQALYHAKEEGKNRIHIYSPEKRKTTRFTLNNEIRVRELACNSSREMAATAKSISIGGVRFESSRPLSIGTKMQLALDCDKPSALILLGTVVRVESQDNNRYEISTSFLEPDKSTRNEFSRYLANQTTRIGHPSPPSRGNPMRHH